MWKARARVGSAVDSAGESMNSINSALATASGTALAAKPERAGGAWARGRSTGGATVGSIEPVSAPTVLTNRVWSTRPT